MDPEQARNSALSIARDMAAEGMNRNQVRAELASLELHHAISDLEIRELVSKNRPNLFRRLGNVHFDTRKSLGAFLTAASLIVLITFGAFLWIRGQEKDPREDPLKRRHEFRAVQFVIASSIGVAAGLWIVFRPDDGDDGMF